MHKRPAAVVSGPFHTAAIPPPRALQCPFWTAAEYTTGMRTAALTAASCGCGNPEGASRTQNGKPNPERQWHLICDSNCQFHDGAHHRRAHWLPIQPDPSLFVQMQINKPLTRMAKHNRHAPFPPPDLAQIAQIQTATPPPRPRPYTQPGRAWHNNPPAHPSRMRTATNIGTSLWLYLGELVARRRELRSRWILTACPPGGDADCSDGKAL